MKHVVIAVNADGDTWLEEVVDNRDLAFNEVNQITGHNGGLTVSQPASLVPIIVSDFRPGEVAAWTATYHDEHVEGPSRISIIAVTDCPICGGPRTWDASDMTKGAEPMFWCPICEEGTHPSEEV